MGALIPTMRLDMTPKTSLANNMSSISSPRDESIHDTDVDSDWDDLESGGVQFSFFLSG